MDYRSTADRLNDYRHQIETLRKQMRQLQAEAEPQEVQDYRFQVMGGQIALSKLFGDKQELFLIHNMGTGCNSCTLWADGFNGILQHLENRAAFVVSSPDDPQTQEAFKASRGWRFRMVSHQGTHFAQDMGYAHDGRWHPGVSVFRRTERKIYRVSDATFRPGDDFCTAWHFFDLLTDGADDWRPKASYM
ncbi:MAG: hypothetical protein JWM91_3209 [Rhodospirillales bacterium]|nr:hypothetical protein [Rhodospirillales bacterium]